MNSRFTTRTNSLISIPSKKAMYILFFRLPRHQNERDNVGGVISCDDNIINIHEKVDSSVTSVIDA